MNLWTLRAQATGRASDVAARGGMAPSGDGLPMPAHPVRALLVTLVVLLALVPVLYRWDGAMEQEAESTASPAAPAPRNESAANATNATTTGVIPTSSNTTDAGSTARRVGPAPPEG